MFDYTIEGEVSVLGCLLFIGVIFLISGLLFLLMQWASLQFGIEITPKQYIAILIIVLFIKGIVI